MQPPPDTAAKKPLVPPSPSPAVPTDPETPTPFADSLPKVNVRDALFSNPFRVRTPSGSQEEEEAPQTQSIVEQIDDILQRQIAGTSLAPLTITLRETPGGGMVIYVDDQVFNSVDEVTNPEVQQAIRKAADTWNKRQSPRG